MQERHKIAARLRRYHIELEEDFNQMLDCPHVDSNFHPREIALLVSFNQAVKRLNQCYAHPQPNATHIDSAWRHAKQLHEDIVKHRVAHFMPQGVENIPRRVGVLKDYPVGSMPAPKTGLEDFPGGRATGLDDLWPPQSRRYVTIDELKELGQKGPR